MSKANEAIGALDTDKWANFSPKERLELLEAIQTNLFNAQDDLAAAEANMKNKRMGEELYKAVDCKLGTVYGMANNIAGAIDLYQGIISGKGFNPGKISKVAGDNDLYDIDVAPRTLKEKLFYATRSDRLRVKGNPKRIGPLEKKTKVVAVLGAGNYSGAVEIIKAIFFDNCVVAAKPHPLNEDVDRVWAKILDPLVQAKCLSFCAPDQGPAMTSDKRVDVIYFTGGVETAKAIIKTTATPLICEAGGVNPTLIVPGDRAWKDSELAHHAMQIVTMGKVNGGHVCARPQLIVTCKNWTQREAFLEHLEKAIRETTYATGSYYPGNKDVMKRFEEAYGANAKRIKPENAMYKNADVLFVTGDSEDGYACKNEAFTQIFVEVPLDTASEAAAFLPYAVNFCNNKVTGSLCANIIIDGLTRKNNEEALQTAVTDMRFGSIGINTMSVNAFLSQYLVWGANEDGEQLVSGNGHFGNVFGFENVQKSIIDDAFFSLGQLKFSNKGAMRGFVDALSNYSARPTWPALLKLLYVTVKGSLYGKDW